MTIIETKGIQYLEHLSENSDWYCGTDYSSGDLWEAEEVYKDSGAVAPNRLIFVHHPEGTLAEPVVLKQNQYFGRPIQLDGVIYILWVDFKQALIHVLDCGAGFEQIKEHLQLPLSETEDCYNLQLKGSSLQLTRQGGGQEFEVLWPEKLSFSIGESESFLYRRGDEFYFSRWMEDPEYREEVVIRGRDGSILNVISGSIFITPAGEEWILQ